MKKLEKQSFMNHKKTHFMKKQLYFFIKCVFLYAIILNGCFVIAQTNENKLRWNETELWQGIAVNKRLTKKWSVGLEENIRLGNSGRQFETGLLETTLSYKLLKKLKLDVAYRYSFRPITTPNTQRISLSASGKCKLNKRWQWSHRVKYQYDFVANRQETDKQMRYKTKLTYNIRKSKLNPFLSAEGFYRFCFDEGNQFDRYRLALGADYKCRKKQDVSFGYIYESSLNENVNEFNNVFYIVYSFDL